ncbi:hypothetical protein LPJ59_000204 [Coemansia sp. RSA 2399]|nr:hypothetical protein LPJ59_000204 [Coemansia sp. RSA 2399]KAJ1908317.1 hypothetical protein LPJ81_000177 [Coemansia sp. IMI 209127]
MVVRRVYGWAKQQTQCFLFHTPVLQDDSLFTTSWFVPQPLLCCARATIFAYCFGVLVTNLAVNVVHGAGWNWAAYFTTLTYVGITMYFGVAAYNTAVAWRAASKLPAEQQQQQQQWVGQNEALAVDEKNGEIDEMSLVSADDSASEVINAMPLPSVGAGEIVEVASRRSSNSRRSSVIYVDASGSKTMAEDHVEYEQAMSGAARQRDNTVHLVLLAAQWILYESFTCFAPLVTIMYWALLYPMSGGFALAADVWMGVSMHAVNSVLMGVEVLALSRIPYALTHLGVLLTFMTLYLGLTYFMVAVYGFYVYPFFEARYFGGYIAIVCLLVVDIIAIIWVAMVLLHYWRDRAYPRWAATLKMSSSRAIGSSEL